MMIKIVTMTIALFMMCLSNGYGAWVIERWGNVYIKDQRGDKWDVTQAKTLGFRPGEFQFGIGKDAFTPLDESHLKPEFSSMFDNPKVIGIASDTEAHAYSVDRLRYHEVANSVFAGKAIAAAY